MPHPNPRDDSKAVVQSQTQSKKKPRAKTARKITVTKLKKLKQVKQRKRKQRESLSVLHNINGVQVPVFSDQFLEQNKAVESELRRLRKLNNDYEEHNSLLSKHIENLQLAVTQLKDEAQLLQSFNHELSYQLDFHFNTNNSNSSFSNSSNNNNNGMAISL